MRFVLLLLAAIWMSGCITMIHGSTEAITIRSTPSGATVEIDGDRRVCTPAVVELERGHDHVLTFSMGGYAQQSVTVECVASPTAVSNVVTGVADVLGWDVDANTGARFDLEPDIVHVKLVSVDLGGRRGPLGYRGKPAGALGLTSGEGDGPPPEEPAPDAPTTQDADAG